MVMISKPIANAATTACTWNVLRLLMELQFSLEGNKVLLQKRMLPGMIAVARLHFLTVCDRKKK